MRGPILAIIFVLATWELGVRGGTELLEWQGHPNGDAPLMNDMPEGIPPIMSAQNAQWLENTQPETLNELLAFVEGAGLQSDQNAPLQSTTFETAPPSSSVTRNALKSLLRGRTLDCDPKAEITAEVIWTPDDEGHYDAARTAQYAAKLGPKTRAAAALKPGLIIECGSEAQVQSAVQFARRCGYKVVTRSGGHSYTGSSSCSHDKCMQLDLGRMNKVSVKGMGIWTKPGVLKAGPGARVDSISKELMKHLMTAPFGGCKGVGIGGHYSSSAWGMLSQSHGSGMDHISSLRMVKADGTVAVISRDDRNSTHYRDILGSAPGSWGVVTEYTVDTISDRTFPHSRMIRIHIPYSKHNFLTGFRHVQFIAKDQEERNARDVKVMYMAGVPSGPEEIYPGIFVYISWCGIDNGKMTQEWKDRYLAPLYELGYLSFPRTFDVPAPLSVITRIYTSHWIQRGDSYAFNSIHSDYWWDDEFLSMMADELNARVGMIPDAYPAFQFLPTGSNAQWARNDGMNSLTWRDARAYGDEWMFVRNESRYDEVVERMRSFRAKTQRYWEYKTGVADRYTWMSPVSILPNATDLTVPETARSFFPVPGHFEHLQRTKAELDPDDIFSNVGTIPLP